MEENNEIQETIEQKEIDEHVHNHPIRRTLPFMSDEKYFTERLDAQIKWYETKSSMNQQKYKHYKKIELILAASIPVFISFATMSIVEDLKITTRFTLSHVLQILASVAGVILVVINKMIELEDYFKNWKTYRSTCEALQHERIKYLTCTDPYDEEDAFPIFVDKIEAILNNENQKWRLAIKPKTSENVEKVEEYLKNNTKLNTENKEEIKKSESIKTDSKIDSKEIKEEKNEALG